ncbi:MAG: ComF family protein [Cellvibrionaceae bacterium]|jgi:ComF family protein
MKPSAFSKHCLSQKLKGYLGKLPSLGHPCLLCDAISQQRICRPCQAAYLYRPHNPCGACGIPLEQYAVLCGQCLKCRPAFDETFAAYLYQAPIDQLINAFKHTGNYVAGKALSLLFCNALEIHYRENHLTLPDYILPVPLHWRRQWLRGFNQSNFICKDLLKNKGCRAANVQLFTSAKKMKLTLPQEQLSRKQRLSNPGKNAFVVSKTLNGESIAIVDDVMTTGATVNALAIALKKAGAGKVSIWALARTPKNR